MRLCNYSLTPTRISSAKPRSRRYKLTDGGGLFVEVSAAGLKTWRYQYRFGGSRREITIGKFPEVGVADARERHFEMRAMLERGIDPLDARRQQESARRERSAEVRAAGDDFESSSRRWIRERLVTKSEKGVATEAIAVSCGVAQCQETLRVAMAIGADRAILVETDVELQPLAVAKLLKAVAVGTDGAVTVIDRGVRRPRRRSR